MRSCEHHVSELCASTSGGVSKGDDMCMPVRVFVTVSHSDSVCAYSVGQHVCASIKVC